jgi:hypothetical protein
MFSPLSETATYVFVGNHGAMGRSTPSASVGFRLTPAVHYRMVWQQRVTCESNLR